MVQGRQVTGQLFPVLQFPHSRGLQVVRAILFMMGMAFGMWLLGLTGQAHAEESAQGDVLSGVESTLDQALELSIDPVAETSETVEAVLPEDVRRPSIENAPTAPVDDIAREARKAFPLTESDLPTVRRADQRPESDEAVRPAAVHRSADVRDVAESAPAEPLAENDFEPGERRDARPGDADGDQERPSADEVAAENWSAERQRPHTADGVSSKHVKDGWHAYEQLAKMRMAGSDFWAPQAPVADPLGADLPAPPSSHKADTGQHQPSMTYLTQLPKIPSQHEVGSVPAEHLHRLGHTYVDDRSYVPD